MWLASSREHLNDRGYIVTYELCFYQLESVSMLFRSANETVQKTINYRSILKLRSGSRSLQTNPSQPQVRANFCMYPYHDHEPQSA